MRKKLTLVDEPREVRTSARTRAADGFLRVAQPGDLVSIVLKQKYTYKKNEGGEVVVEDVLPGEKTIDLLLGVYIGYGSFQHERGSKTYFKIHPMGRSSEAYILEDQTERIIHYAKTGDYRIDD